MELLITLIGNAAVNPTFRQRFLEDPAQTVKNYGFRLTKGEHELMMTVFGKLSSEEKQGYEDAFSVLQVKLYTKTGCPTPCHWSIYEASELETAGMRAA